MSVADIFKANGEEYFRGCEAQVLKELAPYKNLVVSTGGGAVAAPMNWSYMHSGVVAWLEGPPALLARRVVAEGVQKRPLLYGEGVTGAALERSRLATSPCRRRRRATLSSSLTRAPCPSPRPRQPTTRTTSR